MTDYSGKFVLRMSSKMHKDLAQVAKKRKLSLNRVCQEMIERGLGASEQEDPLQELLNPIVDQLNRHFKDGLVGVILFGSHATGDATEASDIDLLIVLKDNKIVRSLYVWWDSRIQMDEGIEINPHFVNYPDDLDLVTGLWFEIAESGKILYQSGDAITEILTELRGQISDGLIRRYISNGHPYWVRRKDEKQIPGS